MRSRRIIYKNKHKQTIGIIIVLILIIIIIAYINTTQINNTQPELPINNTQPELPIKKELPINNTQPELPKQKEVSINNTQPELPKQKEVPIKSEIPTQIKKVQQTRGPSNTNINYSNLFKNVPEKLLSTELTILPKDLNVYNMIVQQRPAILVSAILIGNMNTVKVPNIILYYGADYGMSFKL